MGVFDFVKSGTGEMQLARPRGPREPIALHPEASLPLFGQLVVEAGDAAVFANDKRVLGIVGPGRHVVHPSKLPFLEGFADASGRLAVQLLFVRLTPVEGTRFSGKLDPLPDPASLAAVSPLVDGVLSVQVIDPVAYVEEHLAGTTKPLLARKGIVATLEKVRFALDGRRITVFGGRELPQRVETAHARPSRTGGTMACRSCGEEGEIGSFCAACGSLVTDQDQCIECRAELQPGARFCESCGVKVTRS
jgi:hypothetical protein